MMIDENRNWMPMILWSSEKMYLRRKCGSWWWTAAVSWWLALMNTGPRLGRCPAPSGPSRLRVVLLVRLRQVAGGLLVLHLLQPAVELRLVLVDEETALHLVMAPAAQLGAGQLPVL